MLSTLRKKIIGRLVMPLIVSIGWLGVFSSAQAGIITPAQMVTAEAEVQHLQNVQAFLARDDVRQNLESLGVDPQLAEQRAAQLSPAELAQLSGEIDNMPEAGGSALAVLGVVLIVLIVLEVLGVTNIFTKL